MQKENSSILSVTELSGLIKGHLESRFHHLKVRGEVSSLKVQASGHIYFTLKDSGAQISAVLFQGSAKSLKRLPKDGDQVIVEGEISVYMPRGAYQIIVRVLTYDGMGNLLQKLFELKNELKNLGWFETSRKKPLPKRPKIIGVVTSPTGAVIQDIIHILERRLSSFHLILNPVKVQGEGAKEEIAQAIKDFNRFNVCDVIIVGRGGGSLEDLWAFNERIVAEAIFNSKIPIVAAVGHETDFSISDFVADVRAPTPSAAAEIISEETKVDKERVDKIKEALKVAVLQKIKQGRLKLEKIAFHPKIQNPYLIFLDFVQRNEEIEERIQLTLKTVLERKKIILNNKKELLKNLLPIQKVILGRERLLKLRMQFKVLLSHVHMKREKIKHVFEQLKSVHPHTVLQKGYCICYEENEASVIMRKSYLIKGQKVKMRFYDGLALAEIHQNLKDEHERERINI